MNRRIRILLVPIAFGTALFALQLVILGWSHLASLSAKTSSFARQATEELLATPSSLSWMAFYVALGIAVHALPFALAGKISADLRERSPSGIRQHASQRGFGVLIALLALGTMIAWERYLFPRKLVLSHGSLPESIQALAPVILTSTLFGALLVMWLCTAASRRMLAGTAILLIGLALPGHSLLSQSPASPPERAPDVIVLGVDSLRHDHLPSNGGISGTAPTIDGFLSQSVNFDQAFTPMGRTFVAYMSILSGLYPTQHGVRENLWPRGMLNPEPSLPHFLRDAGYTTAFALDEVRFANLDASFGFDHLIMPPPGAMELVAGSLLDTFGTNLLQLVPGSEHLLPHVIGNRALYHNYRPNLQNRKIGRVIARAPSDKPFLLVAHFCIAHVPFSNGVLDATPPPPLFHDSPALYRKALQVADAQIELTLRQLRAAGRLDNSIVVLLSDHGEGLGMDKDQWNRNDNSGSSVAIPANFGHGMTALEDTENQIVLGFQRFIDGKPVWQPTRTKAPASLVDVTPTLLSVLGITPDVAFDGIAALSSDGRVLAPEHRPVFIESGIFGDSLETLDVDTGEVVNEFAHLYRVTQDLKIELIPAELPALLESKQRGVINGRYGVASMPIATDRGCWLLADYETRTRTCVNDPTEHPVIDEYSRDVCKHFAADTAFHQHWCGHDSTEHLTQH